MKQLIILLFFSVLLFSCQDKPAPEEEISADSIFLLDSKWQNEEGKELKLRDLKGKNLVVVLIFTSCQTACPMLVADMQNIYAKIDKKKLKETSLVMVTIDPENDTPEVLKEYAKARNIYGEPWIYLRSDKESTRELANVLAVKYKKISPVVFSHSNIITVFNKNGEMVSQAEGTVNASGIAETVNKL